MTWLVWRQFRLPAGITAAALAALAVVVVVTGQQLVHLYDSEGLAACRTPGGACGGPLLDQFRNYDVVYRQLFGLGLLAAPAVIGIFWGAPLVAREFENGTWRLAWTQSVSRTRWLAVKLAVVGVASMIAAGMLSFMVSWWSRPVDWLNGNRFNPGIFDQRGIVAVGYAAFAFALGVTAGLMIRRTLPAMAVTLAVFVGVRLAITNWLRPHFWAPAHVSLSLGRNLGFIKTPAGVTVVPRVALSTLPNAWVYSTQLVDASGHAPSQATVNALIQSACPSIAASAPPVASGGVAPVGPGSRGAFDACVSQLSAHFHQVVTYQPASRFWPFQWGETAIFVGLALVLAGFCFWWIRGRVS